MNESFQYLSKTLSGNCIFIDDQHKILLIAPQKCGSTSILKALYDRLVEPSKAYEKTFSHEYTKELCIHKHLKSTQNSSPINLQRIFTDKHYKKILVTRDPIDRLCSSICSKYLLESTHFYQLEIRTKREDTETLMHPYTNTKDFLDDFNEIANILTTKYKLFEEEKPSHATPISEIIPKEVLPFFNHIIDISRKEGWSSLKEIINQHLCKHPDHPQIENFPHINENPLSNSRRFLTKENLIIANERYAEDYKYLNIERSSSDEHQQTPPSAQELRSLNTFISLANRAADLFSLGKIQQTWQMKQLIAQEELSRRTAEELLAENHDLKLLNIETEERIERILNSKETSNTLVRAAEKKIINNRFRSARELLTQVYLRDKSNCRVLLRLLAVSIENPFLRSLMLLATPTTNN